MRLMRVPVIVQLRRTLRLVWQSGPGWTVASVALLVVQAALPLLTLYLIKLVVDAVATAIADKAVAFGRVAALVGLAGAVALVSAVCRSLAGFVSEGQAQAVTDHMHDILHAKAVEVDLEHYENSQYHDTLQRALQEASFRPTHILNGLIQVAQSSIALLVMAGLLFSFHWGVAVILFAAAVPGVILRARYTGQVYRWQRQNTPAERRAWYFHWLLTGIVHAKEVRLFDLGPLFRGRFRDARTRLRRERLGLATRRCAADLAGQSSLILAVFGAYAFIAYRAVQGAITIGDLVMYYQAFQRGQDFLREMLTGLAGLYEDHLFLRSVYEFLDLDRKVLEPPAPKPMPRPLRTGIVFDHVTFHYPTGTREVLQDVSLTIRPGESIALVGENGSGKTTLVKLLCRLYDPTGGAITIDGVDVRDFATAALRREIGVIFQDYAQYQVTAKENIWFGNVEAAADHDRIVAAARRSGADEVIRGLKHGYDTMLGKWFDHGEELSIGEWQKVALARAFMRDAQIVVLDEPTSALDAKAEYEVFKQFRRLAEGRTTILISHRLSTVKMADRIYVLGDGRIVESGTHDELVREGGRYGRLYETQARQYR
ncbi:MAG: ABC transporter ATP-binding protein [Candidatus Rokuibacteriota bacterium]|nr:MAG: ABC transporter ATP-binding protein [Candidatus Rokubacteria bacterium]